MSQLTLNMLNRLVTIVCYANTVIVIVIIIIIIIIIISIYILS
jgi:hypothetical protein